MGDSSPRKSGTQNDKGGGGLNPLELLMSTNYFVYIMSNKSGSVIYIGVTRNLKKRIWEHKQKLVKGFTKKYNASKLVYYEIFNDVKEAIKKEKQIKGWVRRKKMVLIKSKNPSFIDLDKEI